MFNSKQKIKTFYHYLINNLMSPKNPDSLLEFN
jgi:hypothetical protein